jgi:SAM-dependent methyltransferase
MSPAPVELKQSAPDKLGKVFDPYAQAYDDFYRADAVDGRSFEYRNRQQVALRLLDQVLPASASILEFGCGAGHTAAELARRGHHVVCIDISEQMVAATRRTLAAAGYPSEVFLGTVEDLPPDVGPLDAALALGVMDYIPEPRSTMDRLNQLLKPGGCCVLSFANSSTPLSWIEIAMKRSIALVLYLVTWKLRFRDIIFSNSRASSPRRAREMFATAGFEVERIEYFNIGLRLGSFWFPPFAIVRRSDAALGRSILRFLGRGFIVVGRKPEK